MSTTLLKCLKVIETLAQSDEPRGISELAREVDLNKSAIQRIFRTLEQSGYVEKAGSSARYQLTLKIWQIGAQVIERHEIRRQIHPILRYGAKASGLTLYFVIAEFPDAVYLDKVEGEKGRPTILGAGPPCTDAPDRLGQGDPGVSARVRPRGDLPRRRCPGPNAGRNWIEELQQIRADHFSTSISGSIAGVNSVAAPVWGARGEPIGSLCITGDAGVMPDGELAAFGQQAVGLADQATRVIGGSIPGLGSDNP